jgi:hypothetical protein
MKSLTNALSDWSLYMGYKLCTIGLLSDSFLGNKYIHVLEKSLHISHECLIRMYYRLINFEYPSVTPHFHPLGYFSLQFVNFGIPLP